MSVKVLNNTTGKKITGGGGGGGSSIVIDSFTVSPALVEMGRTSIPLMFTWHLSGTTPTSLSIDNGVGNVDLIPPMKSYTATFDPLTYDALYNLTATKGSETTTKQVGIVFNNTFRQGLFEDGDVIDNDFLLGLTSYIQPHRVRTYYRNGQGKKIIFCHSQTYGSVTSVKIGGFNSLSLFTKESFSFTNQYGHTEDYWIYKSLVTFSGENMLIEIE